MKRILNHIRAFRIRRGAVRQASSRAESVVVRRTDLRHLLNMKGTDGAPLFGLHLDRGGRLTATFMGKPLLWRHENTSYAENDFGW